MLFQLQVWHRTWRRGSNLLGFTHRKEPESKYQKQNEGKIVPQMGTGSRLQHGYQIAFSWRSPLWLQIQGWYLCHHTFKCTFFFPLHSAVSSDKLTCSAGRAGIFTTSSDLSLKENFFYILMKDIVMENVQLLKGAETPFYEGVYKLFSCRVCFVACFLGSTPVSVEELDDACLENFVSVGHCWGKGV